MAQGNRLEVDVVANIRAAQKQIEALTSKPYTLNLNTKGRGFEAPLGRIKGQLGEFEKSLEASNARVIAFGASASAIYAVNTALRESVRAAIEVEKALKDINVILNLSDKSLGQFGKSLFDIAKSTGNAFSTVATAATELSRQGLGVGETLKRTQDALILTRLSGLDAASSVEALTASLNGFQKTALTSTQIINKLAAVDASFAVSSADLAEAIKRVGSSAEDAGVSFDELIAIVTATQQITARGGAVIGNSFKTIFTRLQRTETLDSLEQLGIQTRTVEGNIRPLIQVLGDLGKKYDTLNDVQKAAVAEQVGGVFQINILKAALGDLNKEYSIFSNALKISTGATDEAIRRNEELNTTLAALLNKTIANLTAAGAKIGELSLAPALKKVFGGLNSVLEGFTGEESESAGGKIGEGLLKGLGNFLSGPGLIIGAKVLFNIFERLTVFTADALKSLTGLNGRAAEQAQLQQQIFSILQKNPQIIAQINSGQTTLKGLQESILTTIRAQTLAMEQQITLSRTLAASLASAGVSISKTGPTLGRLQAKSGGFVPNLLNQEEANARKMGAVNPKAQMSAGTIGGKKFIKNNKEIEIVGLGNNGDSAVIPTYGSIGDKRQKELYNKLQFLGFVPNFAKSTEQLQATYNNPNASAAARSAAGKQLGLSTGFAKSTAAKTPLKTIPANNVTVVSSYRGTKNDATYFANGERIRFTGIQSAVPEKLLPSDKGNFDAVIKQYLPDAIVGMAKALLGDTNKGFPDNAKIFNDMYSDRSAYPQLAGRIFETVISTAINKNLRLGEQGNRTWDYSPDDFDDERIINALFGPDAAKLNNPFIDAKRSPVGEGSTNETLKSKLFSTFGAKIKAAKAMARGFIPNFAGIKDAIKTEKKMGGNPEIDFQEGIGLYVRDRNTQPNFAAVKRDHPEGIGQAMKNSKIAQETLARGFIPNFAPIGGGGGGGAISKATGDVTTRLLVASFALSTFSGVIESFTKDSESNFSKFSSEILKGASTFASIATVIPGPIGLLVGGLVGSYQAFEGIAEAFRDQTGPLKQGLEQAKENISKINDSSQKYAATFEKLQEAYANPQGTPEQAAKTIKKLETDLAEAASQLPAAYREQLKSAKNLTEIQELIAKAQKENLLKEAQGTSALGLANQIKEQGQREAFGAGGATKAVQNIFSGITSEKQAAFFGKYQRGEVGGLKTRKLADGTESLIGGTEDIINVFKELGASEEELAQISRLGIVPLSQLQKALKDQTDASIKSKQESEALAQEVAKTIEQNRAAAEVERQRTEQIKKEAEAKQISAEANRKSAVSELKLAEARRSNVARIASEAATSELRTQAPFTTARGMAIAEAGVEATRRSQEARGQRAELGISAVDKISSNISNSIQREIDKGLEKGIDVTGLQGAKGRVAEAVAAGGSPQEISQRLEKLAQELNLSDLLSIQSESQATLQEMKDGIKAVDEELNTANVIAEKQLQEQLKQIRNEQRLKALGGMQGFVNPETLKEPVEKLLQGFQTARVGQQYGLENQAARGFAQAGMAAIELTGGAGSQQVNEALKGTVVPQQAKFIEQTFKDLAAQAKATGTPEGEKLAQVFLQQAADAQNIAAAQFDATFQKEQIGQNVAKIATDVARIAGGSPATTQTQGVDISQPFAVKPTTTTGDAAAYLGANATAQKDILAKRQGLEGKTDQESQRQRALLDEQLKSLRERSAKAEEAKREIGTREDPVKAAAEKVKGRPETPREEKQLSDILQRLTTSIESLDKAFSTEANKPAGGANGSTTNGNIGVTFTPISVDIKGSVETENNELNAKMMAAITQAVEQIAPGILAKLKGPPIEGKR
jgi:TP901 family phage tail tape measure protein